MSVLQFYLFGNLRVAYDCYPTKEVEIAPSPQLLLAYLLVNRHHFHRREVLADTFWGALDRGKARRCLSTTLWRLRRDLEADGFARETYVAVRGREEIGFNIESNHWLDVAEFERRIESGCSLPVSEMQTDDAQQLETACQLYSGELLEGIYEDWVLRERERLTAVYVTALTQLFRYYRRHEKHRRSLAYGKQILQIDPYREEIHYELMQLHLKHGHRALAIQQYQKCRELLAKEMGISPMAELVSLHSQLKQPKSADGPIGQRRHATKDASDIHQALAELNLAIKNLNESRKHLDQAAQMVADLLAQHDSR